jgi:chromosome segregation and condensation protein ScpB
MANLEAKIEALLAVSPRPLDIKKLAELTGSSKDEARQAVATLANRLHEAGSGVAVVHIDDEVRMGSAPERDDGGTDAAAAGNADRHRLSRPGVESRAGANSRRQLHDDHP